MIYVKIYLDKDENGEDMLVFDSAKEDGNHFTVAGEKKEKSIIGGVERIRFVYQTEVIGADKVAISSEAKLLFLEMLNDESACSYGQFRQDFAFTGCCWTPAVLPGQYNWDIGTFAFFPPNIKKGDTRRTLRRGESFTVNCKDKKFLEYMTLCPGEMLKSLDLPADEKPLLDAYYAEMRARGEELGCDEDTIRKTPLRYLTEEQKEVIRAEYRRLASSYDKQEWNESRDYDHAAMLEDKIRAAIMQKYGKFISD